MLDAVLVSGVVQSPACAALGAGRVGVCGHLVPATARPRRPRASLDPLQEAAVMAVNLRRRSCLPPHQTRVARFHFVKLLSARVIYHGSCYEFDLPPGGIITGLSYILPRHVIDPTSRQNCERLF